MDILKIEEQLKEGTLKIKTRKKSLSKADGRKRRPNNAKGNRSKDAGGFPQKNRRIGGKHGFLGQRGKTWFRKKVDKKAD